MRQGEVHICLLIWRSRSEYLYVSSGYDNCRNAQSLSKSRCKASHLRLCGVVVGLVVEEMGGHTSPDTHHRTTAENVLCVLSPDFKVSCRCFSIQASSFLFRKPISIMYSGCTSSPYRLTSQSFVRFTSNITKKEFSTSNEK